MQERWQSCPVLARALLSQRASGGPWHRAGPPGLPRLITVASLPLGLAYDCHWQGVLPAINEMEQMQKEGTEFDITEVLPLLMGQVTVQPPAPCTPIPSLPLVGQVRKSAEQTPPSRPRAR